MNNPSSNLAVSLRNDLLHLAERYVTSRGLEPHTYRSVGEVPTILFRSFESEDGLRHGNFHPETYNAICRREDWAVRLKKAHPGKSRGWFPLSDSADARELDSCTSSDALAMSIFCHPSIPTNPSLAQIFGFQELPEPEFGFKANLPFKTGGTEPRSTEIDLQFCSPNRTVLAECKLTEADFTARSRTDVERYADFAETFDVTKLRQKDDNFLHYQLIRIVLAARFHNAHFYLIYHKHRSDLLTAFTEVVNAIADPQLQLRCSVITWQQIAAVLTDSLQTFLATKYGIE